MKKRPILTDEHKAMMLEGKKNVSEMKSTSLQDWQERHCMTLEQANVMQRVSRYAPSRLNTFLKAYTVDSYAYAVKAFCIQCNGFEESAVKNCTTTGCPIWRVRPFQKKAIQVDFAQDLKLDSEDSQQENGGEG